MDVTDEQWDLVQPLIHSGPREPTGGGTPASTTTKY